MNNTPPGAPPSHSSSPQLPKPGDVLEGKYRVDAIIGQGGMGVVLGAEDLSLGRKVAIKFLAPQKADRTGATARFLREARAAASIQSENVVRVFEIGTLPNGATFIVMEHLAGSDLAQTLQGRGPLPIAEAIDYVLQALEAIGEAHGRGIVHRDLKPQNLFLTHKPDGSPCVKVLDFGISKAIDEQGAPNLTSTDMVMGTPLYMSPEQVRSLKSVDLRSDIWALGAILFELLTAAPIYEAASATALCAMIAMDPPIPLRNRRPDAPPELEALVLRCLHKDPNGRFQDVAALADALAPFATERGRASALKVARVVRAGGQQGGYAAQAAGSGVPSPFGTTSQVTGGAGAASTGGSGSTGGAPTSGSTGAPLPGYPHGQGLPPTVGVGGSFPPGAVAGAHSGYPGSSPSYLPQGYGPPPTTQQTWNSGTATSQDPPRRSSSAVVALLGVMTGVVLLGVVGGGGLFLYSKKQDADAATAAAAAASASAALVAVAATAPATGAPGIQNGAPPAPTPPVVVATGPATRKDAGAAAARDAGAAPAKKPDEDLEGQKRLAQGQCQHMSFLLRSNDPKNNEQAKQVKLLTCLHASGPQGATCERQNCRQACSMLQDQQCLFQLDNGERSFPAKF